MSARWGVFSKNTLFKPFKGVFRVKKVKFDYPLCLELRDYLIVELFPQGDFSLKAMNSINLLTAILEERLNQYFKDNIPFKIKVVFE